MRGGDATALSPSHASDLARRALANIAREYPNHPQYLLNADADAVPPRVAHPCFFGCFDWHSAVHNHWLLVRLLRTQPRIELRADIEAALSRSLDGARTSVEADYLEKHPAFERPYGLAWLVLLESEIAECGAPGASDWAAALERPAAIARRNLAAWLDKLRRPVRSGTHSQTAFALTLLIDAAGTRGDGPLLETSRAAALRFYRDDLDAPLRFEPSGEDFLSPALMEADLMRRVLQAQELAVWLARFLPGIPQRDDAHWLPCAEVADESDGRLVHLHGLNLSRAWNLENVANALPEGDSRIATLRGAAVRHRTAGVRATFATAHYAGDHWLPTFAVYLLTAPGER
ncbi:MAG TPA: DUF2891 domain-containing protein [Gammaproteobacteria bacterium]|nr:DUF2891 domain-containing protein [Gammaproteobacteria bacterium]